MAQWVDPYIDTYTQGFLKEYAHWTLKVSYRQPTLGCYIVFARRDIEQISECTALELAELPQVLSEIQSALKKIPTFAPDWFNYFQMGNQLAHLHFHGIPRYRAARQFVGREWVDSAFGHPPVWSSVDESHELVAAIREAIKPHL